MNRFDPIQARLQESQLTALALVPGPNFFYATGAALHASERENLLIIPREGEPFALIPVLEAPYLRPLGIRLYEWSDEAGPLPQLAAMLESEGLSEGVLGIEAEQAANRAARQREGVEEIIVAEGLHGGTFRNLASGRGWLALLHADVDCGQQRHVRLAQYIPDLLAVRE